MSNATSGEGRSAQQAPQRVHHSNGGAPLAQLTRAAPLASHQRRPTAHHRHSPSCLVIVILFASLPTGRDTLSRPSFFGI